MLYSRFLPINVKIEIHKTINFPVFLCGYETWSAILRQWFSKRGAFPLWQPYSDGHIFELSQEER